MATQPSVIVDVDVGGEVNAITDVSLMACGGNPSTARDYAHAAPAAIGERMCSPREHPFRSAQISTFTQKLRCTPVCGASIKCTRLLQSRHRESSLRGEMRPMPITFGTVFL